jgi:hypothetical protein
MMHHEDVEMHQSIGDSQLNPNVLKEELQEEDNQEMIAVDMTEQSEFRPGALAAFNKQKLEDQARELGYSLVLASQ